MINKESQVLAVSIVLTVHYYMVPFNVIKYEEVHVLYLYAYRALKCNYVVLNVTIALHCSGNMCQEFQHEHIQFGKSQTATTIQSNCFDSIILKAKARKNKVEELWTDHQKSGLPNWLRYFDIGC